MKIGTWALAANAISTEFTKTAVDERTGLEAA